MAEEKLTVVMWNDEHGSAAYAITPNAKRIVFDAGSSDAFSPAIWLEKRYSVDRVNLFILSHADCDHVTDIENVDALNVDVFLRNKTAPRDLIYPTFPPERDPLKYYHNFDKRFSEPIGEDSPKSYKKPENWGGVKIACFYNTAPTHDFKKLNDYSVATFILYHNFCILFPGDLEAPGWAALMEDKSFRSWATPSSTNKNEIRFLVAAHHGRAAGVYEPFLDLYEPHLTLISDKGKSQYTDDKTYRRYTQGFPVYNSGKGQTETRYVVSTKVNDFVLIYATASEIFVKI